MAQRKVIHLVDDLDPTGETKADETVEFMLDGVEFAIDLAEGNATRLRATLDPFVQHARRTGGRHKRGVHPPGMKGSGAKAYRADAGQIREWAAANGYNVAGVGRIPNEVVEAYEKARATAKAAVKVNAKTTVTAAAAKRAAKPVAVRKAASPAFATPGSRPTGRTKK